MAKNMQPIAKRCKALGISPAVMGYSKKETNRNPGGQMRKKKSEYALQRALAALPDELAGRFVCLPEGGGARFVLSNPTYACFSGFSPGADMAECVTLSAYGHPIMILYEHTAKEAVQP